MISETTKKSRPGKDSPSQHQRTQNQTNIDVHTQQISLDGFRNIANRKHWNEVLYQWLPTFDPTAFLTRKFKQQHRKVRRDQYG